MHMKRKSRYLSRSGDINHINHTTQICRRASADHSAKTGRHNASSSGEDHKLIYFFIDVLHKPPHGDPYLNIHRPPILIIPVSASYKICSCMRMLRGQNSLVGKCNTLRNACLELRLQLLQPLFLIFSQILQI